MSIDIRKSSGQAAAKPSPEYTDSLWKKTNNGNAPILVV